MGTAVLIFDYPVTAAAAAGPANPAVTPPPTPLTTRDSVGRVPAGRVIAPGRSLGAGVAVDLARRRPVCCLVLTALFTSFLGPGSEECAAATCVVCNCFDNLGKIGGARGPSIAMDSGYPGAGVHHGQRLHAAARGPGIPRRASDNGRLCEAFLIFRCARFLKKRPRDA